MDTKSLLVLTGPTGVGKTAYVNALLDRFPFEVINLDSCQVYTFFRIGTGRGDGQHAHRRHLYGFLSPFDKLEPQRYVEAALAMAHEIRTWGHIPLFEGGSRSLLRALREAAPLALIGLRPPGDPGWILRKLEQRVEGFFEQDKIIKEVEAGLRFGYADTVLMRDPMVYQQTIAYLEGRVGLEETKRAMVCSMKEMHDDQMARFREQDIAWIDADSHDYEALWRLVEPWL
ncbi:isopentenyl transferase family protein [Piscinibacter sp. XHJ-5]|uniref:isopentenyl transferase family protein n=1 Tax=Piscinibacter sp. XHJ-5 TaxID=3037797 RepID=UPI002452D5C3|nr:isopentenyl transferase family protein [Piscinibacter sp. XHJ-5]